VKSRLIEILESRALFSSVGLDRSFGQGGIAEINVPAPAESSDMRLAETAAGEAIVGVRGTARSYLAKLNCGGHGHDYPVPFVGWKAGRFAWCEWRGGCGSSAEA
jgi:hypothetical protein